MRARTWSRIISPKPHGQQAEGDGACKHFAAFIVFALVLFFGFSLLFRASKSTPHRSTGRRELSTVRPRPRQLKTNDVFENSTSRMPPNDEVTTTPGPPLEDVTTSNVPTYEDVTDEALQEEHVSTV
ncbi:hypothetical protein MTO96_022192 [Rhipicephalus appendiculatus]